MLDVHSRSVPPRLSPRLHLASACPCQWAGPVPSSWFHTTLAVSSVVHPAGLLHPAADPGVRRVAASTVPMPRHLPGLDLPRRSTLRSLSTPVAVRRVSTVLPDACLLAVHHPKMARLQGFSPRDGFTGRPDDLAVTEPVQLPWVSSSLACRVSGLLWPAPEGAWTAVGPLGSHEPGGANRSRSGARWFFQSVRLAASGLSRSSLSGRGGLNHRSLFRLPAGTAPGKVLKVGRARGWRVLSFRRFPPHGEERRTEGTGTRREEGSARKEHDRSCPFRSRGTGSVRTIAGLLPGWGLPDIWFHRPITR